MPSPSSPRVSVKRVFVFAIRFFFTLFAVYAFYLSFMLFRLALDQPKPESYTAELQRARMERAAQEAAAARVPTRTPWPSFPGSGGRQVTSVNVNGIPFINDTIELSASRDRILGFYRSRMGRLGWKDTTEEYFRLQPEAVNCSGLPRSLQNESYLRHYDEILRSNLVLQRGDESLHIRLEPGSKRNRKQVLFSYMGAASLNDFSNDLAERTRKSKRSRRHQPWVESSQVMGPDLYTTRMFRSRLGPQRHYEQLVTRLEDQGWTTMPESRQVAAETGAKHFAYLSRGGEFAMVFVRHSTEGAGSYGMMTTVVDK